MRPVEHHRFPAVRADHKSGILVLLIHLRSAAFVFPYLLYDIPDLFANIIMISSMRAERPMPNAGLYSGFKAGINQMMKCFCLDLAPFGIRVNAVEPGAIAVRTNEELLQAGMREEIVKAKEEFAQRIPLGRKGVPNDIAEAVAFLASEKASYITGSVLLVDGALTIPGFPESVGEPGTDAYTWGYIKRRSEWSWADQY